MNHLSIDLLANAFLAEETAYGAVEGHVFAIFGRDATLRTLAEFLRLMQPTNIQQVQTLWGRPFIEAPDVPLGSIVLGCHIASRRTCISDFGLSLANGLDKNALKPSKPKGQPFEDSLEFEQSGATVWGRLLPL